MEIAQIEAFLKAAERGSFRKAAQALYLAQPSISARVRALEEELDAPLFHRMGRGVRLTEMGSLFLPFAQRALDSLREGNDVLDAARDASAGVLMLATARGIVTYTLPSILGRLRERHPGIKAHIKVGRSSDVLKMVVEKRRRRWASPVPWSTQTS